MENAARCRVPTRLLCSNGIAYDGIKACRCRRRLSGRHAVPNGRPLSRRWNLGARAGKDEQRLVQIPLSKLMMPPTHCGVPDDGLRCFEAKFHVVGKWTESTL